MPTLRQGSIAILEELAEDLAATAHLSMADGDEALAVSVVEPKSTTFHVAYRPGSRTPISLGAVGEALLAARDGRRDLFTSEGKILPGAKGVVAAIPGPAGLACAVGVVTLAAADTSTWEPRVKVAAEALEALLHG